MAPRPQIRDHHRDPPRPGGRRMAPPDPNPEGNVTRARPPDPRVVHPLPSAPAFVGRVRELGDLQAAWSAGSGVVALVGLGGAGKTALTARFLDDLVRSAPAG